MNKLNVEVLKDSHRFMNNGLLTKEKVEKAIEEAIKKIDHNMSRLGERFHLLIRLTIVIKQLKM